MNIAIIVAAGRGMRVGGERPKQFRELAGMPLIVRALLCFEESTTIDETIAVVPAAETAGFLGFAGRYKLSKLTHVVSGGQTRTESVWRGLQAVRAATAEVVAIHDGVRPFVKAEEIDACVRAAQDCGAAILAVSATDTIKEIRDGKIVRTLKREDLRHALTPQCFQYELLRRAYEHALAAQMDATDDSALVEQLGASVAIVEGSARNIKITRPEDFALAEMILKQGQ